jgi:hypothetical protein
MLLVSAQVADDGKPRLDVDVVKLTLEHDQRQLEVPFESSG